MIIVFLVLSIIGIIFSAIIDELDDVLGFFFVFLLVINIIALAIFAGNIVSGGKIIDKKILMYEEENSIIEAQIETLVVNYMNYEQDTIKSCNSESLITLVDLYPELKSDTLVSKQIDVYLENNAKIKKLKEDKINVNVYKWWLYFGGVENECNNNR